MLNIFYTETVVVEQQKVPFPLLLRFLFILSLTPV